VAAGLSGMRLRTFLALDLVGTLLWVGPVVGLGYAIGRPAVDLVHRIDHYASLLTIAAVLVLIGVQLRRRRHRMTRVRRSPAGVLPDPAEYLRAMLPDDDEVLLRRALDQLAGLLGDVPPRAMSDPSPCPGWSIQDLVDHIVMAPAKFARMTRGEEVDWSAAPPPAGDDPAAAFRRNGDDLLEALQHSDAVRGPAIDWQCAELAVHTWDLATAVARSTDDLDPEVAERALAFMEGNLTEDNRGEAFAPAQQAPQGANAYQRAAAFAGRSV